jgi:hypothetical protein
MKTGVMLLVLVLAAHGLVAQTGPSRLGASDARAGDIVMSAIQGIVSLETVAKPFLALPPGARVAVVNELVVWAKAYFNSAAFKQAWASERDRAKPHLATRATIEDEVKAQVAEQQKAVDEARKALPLLSPADRVKMEQQIKQMEAMVKDPAQQALMRQMVLADRADQDKRYQDDVKRWQEQYPADHNVLLAKRLRDFLAVSADVNFNAALVTTGRVRRFADPQFEEKPPEWKMCYRAGREATQAARAAATAWLKELGR